MKNFSILISIPKQKIQYKYNTKSTIAVRERKVLNTRWPVLGSLVRAQQEAIKAYTVIECCRVGSVLGTLATSWLRAVQFFRNTVPKNEIQCKFHWLYEIQPFLAENNTKNPNIYKWQKWLAFLVDLLLKLFILKLTISDVTYALWLYARMWLHSFFMNK
jgi:hypothetical protein